MPASSAFSNQQREQAVLDLFAGGQPAIDLAIVEVDDGKSFDRDLLGKVARLYKPTIRMGATSVVGRLPPEVIQRIVRQQFGHFRRCYDDGLRENDALEGFVSISFVIKSDGTVTGVNDVGSTLPNKEVRSCIMKAFSRVSFPSPESGTVKVTYPIRLAPG